MDFNHVVKKRKSVRDFSKKKVDWRHILEAVESALEGPYAGNFNHIKFIIIEDFGRIKEISAMSEQGWIANASAIIVVCNDETNLENLYGERGRIFSRQQAGAAIQSFLLKLTDIGIGSCWVGAYDDKNLKQKLNIPENIQIEAVIPVGYEDKPGKEKKEKRSLESALYWEQWGTRKRPTLFEERREDYHTKGHYEG